MKFKRHNPDVFVNLVVGNVGRDATEDEDEAKRFPYHSSMYITEFFKELEEEDRKLLNDTKLILMASMRNDSEQSLNKRTVPIRSGGEVQGFE
ncbi:hypothetical protein NQ024_03930 [Corynebacterium sp. 35RC1]|nr:hypothetical protein [Corynebacterium sp. 35RC1]